MSGAAEKFCLRWNDFESNISVAFRELREDKDFFDVTLACDDDKQVQAHKVILAACSPFFQRVLRKNVHAHPLLYLRGVRYTDLSAILNFMYHGEVNVAQEELNTFLTAAEDLKVKGLTQSKGENRVPSSVVSRKPSINGGNKPKKPRMEMIDNQEKKPEENDNDNEIVQTVDFPSIKAEPVGQTEAGERSQKGELEEYMGTSDYQDCSFGPDPASAGFNETENAFKWRMAGGHDWDLGAARGLHNPENNIPCLQCGKTFKTRGSLATHKYNFHSNKEGARLPGGDFNFAKLQKDMQAAGSNPFQVELFNQQIVTQHLGDGDLRDLRAEMAVNRDVQCPICGKYFSTRGSLATHKYNYHRDRPHNQGSHGGHGNQGGHGGPGQLGHVSQEGLVNHGGDVTVGQTLPITPMHQGGHERGDAGQEMQHGGNEGQGENGGGSSEIPTQMESLEGLDRVVDEKRNQLQVKS